jgi:hypothetical protein
MTQVERWLLSVLSLIVAASGAAYLWMKYFLVPSDPFAVVNHPWQPYMLDAHVLAAPALLIVFGVVWTSHVRGKLEGGRPYSRRSGLLSLWAFLIMAASGYVLQVLTNETARQVAVIAHVASGGLFTVAYGVHFVASLRRLRQRSNLRSAA